MAFNDDSFIREVNEELRSDQVKNAWKRYGRVVIAAALLIVGGTAAHRGYDYWLSVQASKSGDQFLAAMKLAADKKPDEALAALTALQTEGHGAYPVLARMRAATLQAEKGDSAAAVAAFAAIGNDTGVLAPIRDVARIRAAWLLIETGTYAQVSAQAEQLAVPQNALRHSAREALALSAYKQGDMARAKEWLRQITDDAEAPRNVANRAQMLLDMIASSGKAP